MELNELIAKINFLYHKRCTEGLTEVEQSEQTELRRQYLDIIKGNVKNQLERIELVDDTVSKHLCKDGCHCKDN